MWIFRDTMGIWNFIFGQKPTEVHPSQFEKAELVAGNEIFKLVSIGNKHSALFFDAVNNKTFEIFSSKNIEEARVRFDALKDKFPKLITSLEQTVDVAFLKTVLDSIEEHPQYSPTHLAVLLGSVKDDGSNSTLYKHINEVVPDSGLSPLHLAIKVENVAMVRQLLKVGARISDTDINGWTAYHFAAKSKNVEILEMLGSKDVSAINVLNKAGETALHEACESGIAKNVEMLLKFKANPCITRSSRFPIHCALFTDNVEIVDLLCGNDPRVLHLKETSFGNAPVHCFKSKEMKNSLGDTPLVCKVKEGDFKTSLMLLVEGFDNNVVNEKGDSLIHCAIELDRPDIVQMLIGFGAKVNVVNKEGVTPRHRAAGSQGPNKDTILQYLHLAGAKRCPKTTRDCVVGCAYNAEYNGTPFSEGVTHDMNVFDFWLESEVLNEALSKGPDQTNGDAILTLDGGGVRGIVTAVILLALEEEAKMAIRDLFDVIGGTSTGGILAMGIIHKKSIRYIMTSYFKMKNEVFQGKRPYNEQILEKFLKEEFGGNTKMTDIGYPKVMLMSVLADRLPAELFTFKNFDIPGMHDPHHSFDKRFTPAPKPKDQIVWQAVRATCAATTYFKPAGRFIDGAFIANNPTLDVLTELFRYNRLNEVLTKTKAKPLYVVVSIGTGRPQQKQVEVCDFSRPENVMDLARAFSGFWNIGEMMIDQVTRPDGHIVRRAAAWCGMLSVPFYRFNPVVMGHVTLDCTDDFALCGIMWETQCFVQRNIGSIRRLAKYLVRRKESPK